MTKLLLFSAAASVRATIVFRAEMAAACRDTPFFLKQLLLPGFGHDTTAVGILGSDLSATPVSTSNFLRRGAYCSLNPRASPFVGPSRNMRAAESATTEPGPVLRTYGKGSDGR